MESGGCEKSISKALQSGVLKLAGRELTNIPDSVFRPDGVADGEWWMHCDLVAIDLSHNLICAIDPQIASLERLQSLLMPHNQLEGIALELAELPLLAKLHLHNNKIRDVPPEIMIPSLVELSLSENTLSGLPSEIGQCGQLQVLLASGNRIDRLPASFATLQCLRKLELQRNSLGRLGDEHVIGLTALQEIDISHNRLDALPNELLTLPSLVRCDARHNAISKFPTLSAQTESASLGELFLGFNRLEEVEGPLGQLRELTVLDLGDNKLRTLPESVAALKRLKLLDVRNNDLSNLPPKLALIESLNKVVLDGNPLRAIRRNIVEQGTRAVLDSLRMKLTDEDIHGTIEDLSLEALLRDAYQYKTLDLSNRNLDPFPTEIFDVEVYQLKLNRTNITQLPDRIAGEHAAALRELHLIGNHLSDLPGFLAALGGLSELNMSTNSLSQVPPVLGALHNLKYLDLSRNQLGNCTLPCMSSLEELHMGSNQLSEMPGGLGQLRTLRVLDLNTNKIELMADETFCNLNLVHTIDMSNNELKDLPLSLGHKEELRTLVLNGNPLRTVRHQIISKGTGAVLEYLRGREPPKPTAGASNATASSASADEVAAMFAEMDLKIGELEDQVVAPGLSGPKVYALKKQLAMAKAAKKKNERELAQQK